MIPIAVAAVSAFAVLVWAALRQKNADIWIGSYVRSALRRKPGKRPADVYFCLADHFEPYWAGADRGKAHERVRIWCEEYPRMAEKHRDSDGRPPQHTYFYPEEEYDPELLDRVSELCRKGYGDVEVHLHHDNDTAEGLRGKLERFKKTLHERHGFLKKDPATGRIEYAFIHGNWALDNSRKDGRWCGVDNELAVLKETGCYADFTLPSAPSETQTRKINSIYFADGGRSRRKSHDDGRDARVGHWDPDGLLMIQGPLGLNWKSRKWGVVPRIENAELTHENFPDAERVRLWGRQRVHVQGQPDKIFIKVHTHGLQDRNIEAFFRGGLLDRLYRELSVQYGSDARCRLHFVTAREMYETVRSICLGSGENGR